MMLFLQRCCFIQSLHFSYELQEDSVQNSKQCSSVPLHPSERRGIPSGRSSVKASSVLTTRTFRPDVPLCPKASNCSRLHPSRRLSNTFGCLSMFDKSKDFFPKHKYGKIAAIVRTMWLFHLDTILDNFMQKMFNRPNVKLHGPDAQDLIWKLRVVEVQPSGSNPIQERISRKFGKPVEQLSIQTLSTTI
jgi:hypothetical protein